MNRRTAIKTGLLLAGATTGLANPAWQGSTRPRFRIGACDWSINALADLRAFDTAKEIGLDGVQVSLNTVQQPDFLQQPSVQAQYLAASRRTGVRIGGLALGILNEIPYKSDPRTEQWVSDSIDVAKALGVKTVLLAFFSKNDLRDDPGGTKTVVERLRAVAPKAEKAGITLGIESWLSAAQHLAILEAVGSPAVQVYYDVCNATVRGYDIFQEMRDLSSRHICEVHIKENGHLLGQGQIDLPRVRQTLDAIGYTGWLQIEGAVPDGKPMLDSYRLNIQTMRQLFT